MPPKERQTFAFRFLVLMNRFFRQIFMNHRKTILCAAIPYII